MSAIVIRALSVLSSSHYLGKISKDACILHYKRSPTWRSLAVLIGKYKKKREIERCVNGDLLQDCGVV